MRRERVKWGWCGGSWEVIRSPTCPTAAASPPPLSSLLPWLVSMCRAQGLENEWRPGSAWALKPARNVRPLFSLSLPPSPSLFSSSCSVQQWNIPSAALIVHLRAGRHRPANHWLPLGRRRSWWGEKGLDWSLPSNIWLSWLLGPVWL